MLRVLVCGAAGQMGRAVTRGVLDDPELVLAGGVDPAAAVGMDLGVLAGRQPLGLPVLPDLASALSSYTADMVIDFTRAAAALQNASSAMEAGSDVVIGTTGFTAADLAKLQQLSASTRQALLVAPNFSIGALLAIRFAAIAAQHLGPGEIVELHRPEKLDAPSGTAVRLAEAMAGTATGARGRPAQPSRGEAVEGVPVHSLRLAGFVARHDVYFARPGERLVIHHEVTDRSAFVPGVLLAVKRLAGTGRYYYGLEQLFQL